MSVATLPRQQQSLARRPQALAEPRLLPQPQPWLPDESNFGAFGRLRQSIDVLKPEAITMLAAYWATGGRAELNGNDIFGRAKLEHSDWFDTLRVIEAYDRSLMLPATRLVMHMIEDPHQIPDSPPPQVMARFMQALQQHPDAKIWYAEPVFALNATPEALPVAVSEEAFMRESSDRVLQAKSWKDAYGWLYRGHATWGQFLKRAEIWIEQHLHDRKLARERRKAELLQRQADAHVTALSHGRSLSRLQVRSRVQEIDELERRYEEVATQYPELNLMTYRALTEVQVRMYRFDPLLFIELPDEPNLLRLVGHWFWQAQGQLQPRRLHLHL